MCRVTAPERADGRRANQYYDGATKTQFFRPGRFWQLPAQCHCLRQRNSRRLGELPDVSGLSGWSGSTGGVDTTSPYGSPADYTWSSGAAEPGARNISGTDKAAEQRLRTRLRWPLIRRRRRVSR